MSSSVSILTFLAMMIKYLNVQFSPLFMSSFCVDWWCWAILCKNGPSYNYTENLNNLKEINQSWPWKLAYDRFYNFLKFKNISRRKFKPNRKKQIQNAFAKNYSYGNCEFNEIKTKWNKLSNESLSNQWFVSVSLKSAHVCGLWVAAAGDMIHLTSRIEGSVV